jgi:hypothetical protein
MFLMAAAMAVLLTAPLPASGSGKFVLLVYSQESEHQSISNVLSACGYQVKSITETDYTADSIAGCTAMVTTARQPYIDGLDDGIPVLCIGPAVLPVNGIETQAAGSLGGVLYIENIQSPVHFQDQTLLITKYNGIAVGEMEFPLRGSFPYGVITDSIAYVPGFAPDDIQPLALSLIARRLFQDPEQGRLFLLIDEVYPFSDMGMLCHMADELYARGYPFTLSAMPVYDNLEYPAYMRYTQVLRYMQFRGGAVVMHEPIIRASEIEMESTDVRLDRARAAFTQQGIVLVNGIVSPYAYSLAGFSNLLCSKVPFGPLPMDISITLPIAKSFEEFNQALQVISKKWVPVSSLLKMVTSEPFLYNEQPVDSGYDYREEVQTTFEGFFSAGNETLIIIVVISLIFFSGLLTGGYFLYRRKFYR